MRLCKKAFWQQASGRLTSSHRLTTRFYGTFLSLSSSPKSFFPCLFQNFFPAWNWYEKTAHFAQELKVKKCLFRWLVYNFETSNASITLFWKIVKLRLCAFIWYIHNSTWIILCSKWAVQVPRSYISLMRINMNNSEKASYIHACMTLSCIYRMYTNAGFWLSLSVSDTCIYGCMLACVLHNNNIIITMCRYSLWHLSMLALEDP